MRDSWPQNDPKTKNTLTIKWGRAICPCSQEVASGVPAGGKEKEVCVGLSRKTIWIGPIGVFLSSGRCFPDTKKVLKSKRKLEKRNWVFLVRKMGITEVPFGRTELSLRLSWTEFGALASRGGSRGPLVSRNARKVVFSWFSRGGHFSKKKLEKLLIFFPDHRTIMFKWF